MMGPFLKEVEVQKMPSRARNVACLSREPRRAQPASYIATTADVDNLKNQCVQHSTVEATRSSQVA